MHTLREVLKRQLFDELVCMLTVGFVNNDLVPLTINEQMAFFNRIDIKQYMEYIVNELEQIMSENDNDSADSSMIQEIIYEYDGIYETVIRLIEENRKHLRYNFTFKNSDFLTYDFCHYTSIDEH